MNDPVDLCYKLEGKSNGQCSSEKLLPLEIMSTTSQQETPSIEKLEMVEGEAVPNELMTSYSHSLDSFDMETSQESVEKVGQKAPFISFEQYSNVPCKSEPVDTPKEEVTLEETMESDISESEGSESEAMKVVRESDMKDKDKSEDMEDTDESEAIQVGREPEISMTVEDGSSSEEKRYFCLSPKCRMSYTSEWRLLCHKQLHTNLRPLICAYPNCFKPYLSEGSFRIHQVKHEKGLITDEPLTVEKKKRDTKNFHCPFQGCESSFARKWRLESHIAVHEGRKPYKCEFPGCDKQYSNLPHLKRHSHIHTPDEPLRVTTYPCTFPDCFQILKTKQNLEKHFRRKHTEKEFKCEFCPDSFSTKVLLDLHAFKFHDGPPHFQCSFCPGVGFTHKREYNRHLRKHRVHMCPVIGCFEMFDDYTVLRKHVAAVHPPEYICNYCQKAIRNKNNFIRHIQQHLDAIDGIKPFRRQTKPVPTKCDICGLLLASKGSCDRHKRKKHKLENVPIPITPKEEKPRAERSDAGIPKLTQASLLSGVRLPPEINLILIKNGEYKHNLTENIIHGMFKKFETPDNWEINPVETIKTIDEDIFVKTEEL